MMVPLLTWAAASCLSMTAAAQADVQELRTMSLDQLMRLEEWYGRE